MTTYRQPGTVLTDHRFTVPLDHARPDGPTVEVFAREVVAADRAGRDDLPWLLYLEGGPGFGAPRPVGRDSWLGRALNDYRVLLMDQRGTGRSTPANRRTLAGLDPVVQADYLAHFRADSIVRDAELIRRELLGDEPWSILGQSFGGFCSTTYLSLAPEGLREAFITGGLPGLDATAEDVYRRTYPLVAAKNAAFAAAYPQAPDLARRVAFHLRDNEVRLPAGGLLTVERFQSLGLMLGMSDGAHRMNYLLESAFDGEELSDVFLRQVEDRTSFVVGPFHAILHEACYGQGAATRWAAQRVRAEFPEFDVLDKDAPFLFTGEMTYPWMFEHDPYVAPLREAALLLAEREGWPALYDADRLAANTVPVAAAVYHDDMYVDRGLSLDTAAVIAGLRPWVTNEYEHDGLRVSGGRVLDRLIALVRGEA